MNVVSLTSVVWLLLVVFSTFLENEAITKIGVLVALFLTVLIFCFYGRSGVKKDDESAEQ